MQLSMTKYALTVVVQEELWLTPNKYETACILLRKVALVDRKHQTNSALCPSLLEAASVMRPGFLKIAVYANADSHMPRCVDLDRGWLVAR